MDWTLSKFQKEGLRLDLGASQSTKITLFQTKGKVALIRLYIQNKYIKRQIIDDENIIKNFDYCK